MNNDGKIETLIPRNLCSIKDQISLEVNAEGLSAVEISWKNGVVTEIQSINKKNNLNHILFPRFVETHAHIDKSFSWKRFPNLQSNYENALSVNIEEHISRTSQKVIERAEKSLNLAIKNGYRAIRTHIDTYDDQGQEIWDGLFNLKEKYASLIKIQFVALAPLEYWLSPKGELFAQKLKKNNGILGGVIVPPFQKKKLINVLTNMLLLAKRYNLEIDLHIDEATIEPGSGVKILLKVIDNLNSKVPITCSHLSSILLMKEREMNQIIREISERNIKVIALPLTNFWLLNRNEKQIPIKRPVAPIKQLQKTFVDVSIGSDNVQDPWYPFGNFDPFYLMSFAMPLMHLNPWDRLSLSAIFTAPSRLLNLSWDGIVAVGSPADFVIVEAKSWADLFSGNLRKKVLINGIIHA